MRRVFIGLFVIGLAGLLSFGLLTRPVRSDAATLAGLAGDEMRGEQVFWAAGCASCHSAAGAEGDARLVLSGGRPFATAFGTFFAPNISPDLAQGIGGWSLADLDTAMRHGTSPEGEHYYPAFPYTSYTHALPQDVADLKAFMDTLPASDRANEPHQVGFPFNQRILLGGWKLLFASDSWVIDGDLAPDEARGRYLVEGLGHCSECHTPRNALGGRTMARWLAGGPNPDGPGRIPNITPAQLTWSAEEVASYLKSGFTPDFDVVGGSMGEVVENIAHLPDSDRAAIAAYLAIVPSLE